MRGAGGAGLLLTLSDRRDVPEREVVRRVGSCCVIAMDVMVGMIKSEDQSMDTARLRRSRSLDQVVFVGNRDKLRASMPVCVTKVEC